MPRETAEEFAKRLMALPQSYEHSWEERASVLVRARDRETAEEMRERAKLDAYIEAQDWFGDHAVNRCIIRDGEICSWCERIRTVNAAALPLDPPADQVCGTCNGSAIDPDSYIHNESPCPDCDGTGKL